MRREAYITTGVVLGGLLIANALLSMSLVHVGNVTLLLAGILLVILSLFPKRVLRPFRMLASRRAGKAVLWAAGAVLGAAVLLFVGISVAMVDAADRPVQAGATVVVLGAQLNGEEPSPMLDARLRVAANYLYSNPQSMCIVAGGQGENEVISEALAMKRRLIEYGVSPHRIYMEEQSTSTYENLRNAARIIEREGLSKQVVIATQEFHQLRAAQFAERNGLQAAGALTASTPTGLLLPYWIREVAGICHMILFGT